MKYLIVFYSFNRKTGFICKNIARYIDCEIRKLEEIDDSKKRRGFFGFFRSGRDAMKDRMSEIKDFNFSFEGFDAIILATPVWGSKCAPAVNTFISKADLTGKNIILLATHGGEDGGPVFENMKSKIEFKGGKVINTFGVRTGGNKAEVLALKAKDIASKLK
jgi:hypothetical protein